MYLNNVGMQPPKLRQEALYVHVTEYVPVW